MVAGPDMEPVVRLPALMKDYCGDYDRINNFSAISEYKGRLVSAANSIFPGIFDD